MAGPLAAVGSLLAGAGRLLGGAAGGVARGAASGASRLGRVAGMAARGRPFGGRLFGQELWKLAGGATQREIKNANPGWERAALRQQNLAAMDRLVSQLGEYANGFSHSITVGVKGGPGADLRRCYYLACAAAFGRFKQGVTVVLSHEFQCHWDITGKQVSVTVAYTTGGTTGLVNSVFQAGTTTPLDVIQRGPDQLTLGASWPRFLKSVTGIVSQTPVSNTIVRGGVPVTIGGTVVDKIVGVATQTAAPTPLESWRVTQDVLRVRPLVPQSVLQPWILKETPNVLRERGFPQKLAGLARTGYQYTMRVIAPAGKSGAQTFTQGILAGTVRLPDEGRVITTGELYSPLVQPPRPPVDGISRGGLIRVTTAALLDPGFLPELPALTEVPVASTGYYPTEQDMRIDPATGVWVPNVPPNPPPQFTTIQNLTENAAPLLRD